MTHAILNSIAFSLLGVLILVVCFALIEILTPKHNIRREILDHKNMAAAVLAGCFMIAIAIIIASAIH